MFPACAAIKLSKCDVADVPSAVCVMGARQGRAGKVVAQLMGHTNADVTLNVYTQVVDGAPRNAANRIGSELFTIIHGSESGSELSR